MNELTQDDVQELQAPFATELHDFVTGNVYVKEQAVQQRLWTIDPGWSMSEPQIIWRSEKHAVVSASMTIKGATRWAVGEHLSMGKGEDGKNTAKSAATDWLKRAARMFGVGLYLTETPKQVKDHRSLGQWLGQLTDSPQDAQKQVATPRKAKGKGKQQARAKKQAPAADAQAEADYNSQTIVRVDYIPDENGNDGEPYCRVYLHNGEKAYIKDLDVIRSLGVSTGNWKTGDVIQGAGWFGNPYLKAEKDYLLVTRIDPPKDWDALTEQATGWPR